MLVRMYVCSEGDEDLYHLRPRSSPFVFNSAKKRAGRSTRQSSRKTAAPVSKVPLQESKDNENESEPSDESEEGAGKKERVSTMMDFA